MYAFTFERPSTTADAAKLAAGGAKVLAGGQTLLASMKLRLSDPGKLVDLAAIPGMSGVKKEGNSLVIGAMTRHVDVANNADVKASIPALADLASHIGDRQVRAMGTLGGSVANNDPSACYPSAVLALGATVHTTQRKIPADEYFQGMFTTALKEDELITAISFPIPKKAAYMKFKQPASRFALIGVFVAQTDGGVRVAVTGGGKDLAGPKPVLFFAPAQVKKRIGDWGGAEFGKRMVDAWRRFALLVADPKAPWLKVERHVGAEAVQAAYGQVLGGKGDPRVGHVLSLRA